MKLASITTCVQIGVLLLIHSISASATERPEFDFKGIKLGTPISVFLAIAPDILPNQLKTSVPKPNGFPVCTDSNLSSEIIWPDSIEKLREIGVITCTFAYTPNEQYTLSKANVAAISIGNYATNIYWFSFAKMPGDDEPKLYQMLFSTSSNAYDSIIETLTNKYGKPTSHRNEIMRNAFNATFQNETANWKSKTASIEIRKYFADIDHGMLHFELKKYSSFIDQQLASTPKKADF